MTEQDIETRLGLIEDDLDALDETICELKALILQMQQDIQASTVSYSVPAPVIKDIKH